MKIRRLIRPCSASTSPVTCVPMLALLLPVSVCLGSTPPCPAQTAARIHSDNLPRHAPPVRPGGQQHIGAREITRLEGVLQGIGRTHPFFHAWVSKMGLVALVQGDKPAQVSTDPTGRHTVDPHRGSEFRRQLPNDPHYRVL